MLDCRQTNNRKKLRWYTCDCCGFPYPENRVTVVNGRITCSGAGTVGCRDAKGHRAYMYQLRLPIEQRPKALPVTTEIL